MPVSEISLETDFFGKIVSYPFIISCMTGGSSNAGRINEQLAEAAEELNIPIGVGSQRQALENDKHHNSYKIVREIAKPVPVMSNIGAAEVCRFNGNGPVKKIIE